MNPILNQALFDMGKVDALMHSAEDYLEIEVLPEAREEADRGAYLFYALWDAIRKVADDLDRLAGESMVVDAIYAANDVRQRKSSLTTE